MRMKNKAQTTVARIFGSRRPKGTISATNQPKRLQLNDAGSSSPSMTSGTAV
jgi:hypothetical protein